jgi:hypothetical protein
MRINYSLRNLLLSGTALLLFATITSFAADGQANTSNELKAMPASANSITLTWTAPGDDSVTGTAAQYDIRYSTAPITVANYATATQVTGEPAPKIAGSAETFTVTGLTPSTLYYFAIKTADEVPNWSGLSNVASISTLDNIPPAAIKNLAVQQ